jgi:hypothetical protein
MDHLSIFSPKSNSDNLLTKECSVVYDSSMVLMNSMHGKEYSSSLVNNSQLGYSANPVNLCRLGFGGKSSSGPTNFKENFHRNYNEEIRQNKKSLFLTNLDSKNKIVRGRGRARSVGVE